MKAKFRVTSVTATDGGTEIVKAIAVQAKPTVPENETFSRFTPSGTLELVVNNPDAKGFFKPGQSYYLDITPAD